METPSAPLKSRPSFPSTDLGTQTVSCDEQPRNESDSIRRSFDPTSIRTSSRFLHFRKLDSHNDSIDTGITIDFSFEHFSNARGPIDRTLGGDANSNPRICLQFENDPTAIDSISGPILTCKFRPKYRMIDAPSKLIKKS
jgi:hypothetical protein